MTADNKSLGRFILDGIPPSPRGRPQIEVTFDVDASGILAVKAKDKTTGREQSIRIEARSSLTPEDIERMKKEAEQHAVDDREKREAAEMRNSADQLVYAAEQALKDAAGKISEEIKKDVQEKIEAVKKLKESGAASGDLKQATSELSDAMMKIGEAIQKSAPSDQNNPGDNQPPGGDNIRDAETK